VFVPLPHLKSKVSIGYVKKNGKLIKGTNQNVKSLETGENNFQKITTKNNIQFVSLPEAKFNLEPQKKEDGSFTNNLGSSSYQILGNINLENVI
jgi:hypothetical protein